MQHRLIVFVLRDSILLFISPLQVLFSSGMNGTSSRKFLLQHQKFSFFTNERISLPYEQNIFNNMFLIPPQQERICKEPERHLSLGLVSILFSIFIRFPFFLYSFYSESLLSLLHSSLALSSHCHFSFFLHLHIFQKTMLFLFHYFESLIPRVLTYGRTTQRIKS